MLFRSFYHTTMCLLSQTHPTRRSDEPDMYDMKMQHARMICGIVAHVKDRLVVLVSESRHILLTICFRGVASAAIRCVVIAAECLEEYEEQAEILRILEKIHKETGWGIHFLQPELKKKWGWNENPNPPQPPPQSSWGSVGSASHAQQQMASAAASMMQGTPPSTSGSFGFGTPGSTSMTTSLPPVAAPQMPSPPTGGMPRGIPSGIVNPLMRTADFSFSQHPYQNDYVAPNHPSGQDGGFFTRLTESGMYQQYQ